jgi:Domain of unknown function (DUF4349)
MSEFDLETLVRAVRPEPEPQWARQLDHRVVGGFPRWWQWQQIRPVLGPLAVSGGIVGVLILIIVGAALSGGGASDDDSASSGSKVPTSATIAPDSAKTSSSAGSSAAAAPVTTAPAPPRAQIHNVSLTLSTTPADVESVSDSAMRVADQLGGYVSDSSVTARQSADITLAVPVDKLQQALTQLARLAHVSSRTQETQDVTDSKTQLESDVRDARAYRDSLRARLAHASTDRQASSLRGRLQRAESALRARERDLAKLGQQTSMATIDLKVRGDRHAGGAAAPVKGGAWTPGDALHDAGRVLEVVAGVLLIALAVVVPIGLLALIAVLVGRLVTRRRRERALELA